MIFANLNDRRTLPPLQRKAPPMKLATIQRTGLQVVWTDRLRPVQPPCCTTPAELRRVAPGADLDDFAGVPFRCTSCDMGYAVRLDADGARVLEAVTC